MKRVRSCCPSTTAQPWRCWSLLLFLFLSGISADGEQPLRDDGMSTFLAEDGSTELVTVVATLNNGVSALEYKGAQFKSEFERTNAVKLTVPVAELEELRKRPEVQEVEGDPLVYPMNVPWGVRAVQGTMGGIPPAKPSSDCFSVCLVDSGVKFSHPDMPYDYGRSDVEGKGFDVPADQLWYDPKDPHGTHVAGTIFATANSGKGVLGVIPNPRNICIKVARVFDDRNKPTTTSVIDKALEWCADQKAKVINLSLGARYKSTNNKSILNRLYENEGILIVAAAGNSGSSAKMFPASFNSVISVGATTKQNKRASYSQHNAALDLVAPGSDIMSLSTRQGGYEAMSGTSMSVPHVSGVIAKIWAARPKCSNKQIREAIEQSARDLGKEGRDDEYGHGLIQAHDAYKYLLAHMPAPCGDSDDRALAEHETDESNAARDVKEKTGNLRGRTDVSP